MTNKLLVPSGVFAIFILLAISSSVSILADGATTQQSISANTYGFAFTDNCCPDASLNLNGNITTNTDGTIELSQQSGNIAIGSTDYKLQFTPSGKITTETVGDDCSSGITYQQDGAVSLVGNDGTVIKGSGEYSWGRFLIVLETRIPLLISAERCKTWQDKLRNSILVQICYQTSSKLSFFFLYKSNKPVSDHVLSVNGFLKKQVRSRQ
ncbi:MAG: hypothetical protein WA799_06430 [Nitrosotalea sp.]